jgi:hypothetical protein
MSTDEATAVEPPDFLRSGIRCALEMVLAGGLVLLVGLPAENDIFSAIVIVLAIVVMIVVLFWALNRHIRAWIRAVQAGQGG